MGLGTKIGAEDSDGASMSSKLMLKLCLLKDIL